MNKGNSSTSAVTDKREDSISFKPRANILTLLGDQLIGNKRLAIFELVKNSYDADAERVVVTIKNPEDIKTSSVEVVDYGGEGMSLDVINNIWLEPGADHKKKKKEEGYRTEKYKRVPLGEKGLGRFAVHKLGSIITLNTRSKNNKEFMVKINWDQQVDNKYLEDTYININEVDEKDSFFKEGQTGTRVYIEGLREPFDKEEIRSLYRNILSIKSPFEGVSKISPEIINKFDVELLVPGYESWLSKLLDVESVINHSLYKFKFMIVDGKISYEYAYTPNNQLEKETKVPPRDIKKDSVDLLITEGNKDRPLKKEEMFDIGSIYGEFYVHDLDPMVTSHYQNSLIAKYDYKDYLEENGGVRVYRDGIRVYNYGEPSDDWLGQDRRRINRLSKGINKRLILGAIDLSLADTPNLLEKTNREGFVENNTYFKLQSIMSGVLSLFENEREKDRKKIKEAKGLEAKTVVDINTPINKLRDVIKEKGYEGLDPLVKEVEKHYNQMKEIMTSVGVVGLNTSVALHEMHHGFSNLIRNIDNSEDIALIKQEIKNLQEMLDMYSRIMKKTDIKEHKISSILKSVISFNQMRFKIHNTITSCPVLSDEQKDYDIKIANHLVLGAITNIIDNAIFWLDVKWGEDNKKDKYIYFGVTDEFNGKPAIVIADSGDGFKDLTPEELISPFITNKPGGMGMGLYFVNTVMNMMGGELLFVSREDLELDIPEKASGALLVLLFNK